MNFDVRSYCERLASCEAGYAAKEVAVGLVFAAGERE